MKPVLVNRRVQVTVGVFLTLIVSDSASTLQAQSEHLRFTHLTVENGLSQNTVRCILQDREGFLWFGTQDGLNKYDGYNLTVYYHNALDSSSLPANDIGAIIEDRAGNLWLLVMNMLCRLNWQDKDKGKFIRYNITATALCEDDSGMFWLADQAHFTRFDPNKNKIVQRLTASVTYPDGGEIPWSFFKDPQGAIWSGLAGGEIIRLFQNPEGRWQLANDNHNPIGKNHLGASPVFKVQTFYNGREKLAWLGMYGGGICRMRLVGNQIMDCEHFLHDPANPRSLSSNSVHTLLVDKNGTLWVGTNGGGLCKLVQHENGKAEFIRYQYDAMDPNSLSDNDVWSIYQDHSGMIWVGTNGGGINKFDPEQREFRHYRRDADNPTSLQDNTIWSFYEDRHGAVWVGTNNGLTQLTRNGKHNKEKFIHFAMPIISSYSSVQVRAICEDHSGRLWIGTSSNGLGEFDRASQTFTFYKHDSFDANSLVSNNIYTLYPDSSGTLWIGMNGGGFAKMWRDEQQCVCFKNYFGYGNGMQDKLGWVITIHPTHISRDLWLGTWGKGLLRFDPQRETFTPYLHDSANTNSLSHNTIFAIYEDSTGTLWLGTYGSGLDKLNPKTAMFTHYTTRHGLADNVVYGILPDEWGNLWLSTNKGISKFNPRTERFQNFDVTDGLQSNEFNLGAALRTRNGEMFFGGNNGFNRFRPVELNTAPPEIVLTAFKKLNKAVLFDTPLIDLKKITLSYRDDFFSFTFAAVDYRNPAKNRYAYMMEGFDDDWIHIGNKREATYTNLDPGEYTFRVKAANSDGVWNEEGLSIQVKITPPYWRTWWFALLTFIAATGAITALYRYRVQQKLAIERVRFRERETMQKKIASNVHDDFACQLTQITVATGIVKQQAPELPAPALKTLDKIAAHAAELSRQMKDFIWNLDPEKDTLYHLAEQWKNFSDTLFEYTDIAFQLAGLTPDFDAVQLPVEWKQHLYLIFKEAMHNVLKHAANCRNVTLAIAFQNGSLQVSLTNDGQGFDATNERRGNGLQNMRRRAQELGGTLEILSEKAGGTTVRFIGKLPERPVAPTHKFAILKEASRFFRRIL